MKKEALETLQRLLDTAVAKGIFGDAGSVILVQRSIEYLSTLPELTAVPELKNDKTN